MPLTVVLTENDLFTMPPSLRDDLLKWYFGKPRDTTLAKPGPTPPQTEPSGVAEVPEIPDHDSRRVTFRELVDAGLLKPGDEVYCRSLKRQQKKGAEPFIKGAVVGPDGRVEFQKHWHPTPSKLAVAMLNASGAKTPAVNGYAYLFAKSGSGTISLDALRRKLIGRDPVEEGSVDDMMEMGGFGSRAEARRYLRQNPIGGK